MNTYDTKPRRVSAAQMERLANWSLRKPVIALMGEFSAGKSTLLNLLLGENVLPTQVTATRMPPVWLRYGSEPAYRVDRNGQQHPVNMKDPSTFPLKDTRFIRVHVQSPMLRNCDLMDTPGISDPNIPTDSWIRAIGYANAVLWCTHAGQAWRESERSAWEALPMRLRRTSLLLVTRADKIVNAVDRDKIDRRMQRETSQLFDGRHFVSLTNAKTARDAGDDAGWQASGAAGFMDSLTRIIEGVGIERSYLVSRYQVSDGASTESFVTAAREAKAEAAAVLAANAPVAEEQVDFAEAIARAAAEGDAPVVSLRSSLNAQAEDTSVEEPEGVTEDVAEPVEEVAEAPPVTMLRRIRPEAEPATERPTRSAFDDRVAQLNQLTADVVAAELPDEPVEPEDAEAVSALRDAFATDMADDAGGAEDEVLADDVDLQDADTSDEMTADEAAVEEDPVGAEEAEAEVEEDTVALISAEELLASEGFAEADETVVETETLVEAEIDVAEVEVAEIEADDAVEEAPELAAEDEEPLPVVAPVSMPPAAPVHLAAVASSTGDSIDDLVSILSAAVPHAHKPTPIRENLTLASASEDVSLTQEAPAIRETWADMQSRYNIAAMPRLAQMMTSLLADLANDETESANRAAAEQELAMASHVVADEIVAPPTERRFVRGLF